MKVTFNIRYYAHWGETLCMVGNAGNLRWDEQDPLRMVCIAPDVWRIAVELPATTLHYHYCVRHADGTYRHEWGERSLDIRQKKVSTNLVEYWQDVDYERIFTRTPFSDTFSARKRGPKPPRTSAYGKAITFRLFAPQVEPTCGIAVTGNIASLGQWDPARKLPMSDASFPWWEATIDPEIALIEYKFVVYDLKTGAIVDYESGSNRLLAPALSNEGVIICNDYNFHRTRPRWKGAGTAIPIFSLRSHDSFGIGEFQDLVKFGKWAASTGQKMIQTLPVNDTTLQHNNRDSYPYNAVSVFALNPNYLNIEQMGSLKPAALKKYQKTQKEFNAKTFADYQVVADEKSKYFRMLYRETAATLFATKEYQEFFAKNSEWLKPYAVFCYLREKEGTAHFHDWKEYSTYSPEIVEKLSTPGAPSYEETAFHYFLQFHADKQLKAAHRALKALGVGLKGDIPIGISPDSVDAWTHPELFNLDTQTGAPPDDFSISGQNWGFPTYNWDVMAKDGYRWFCRRFSKMSDYFDAYRIDHILGFFRIWEMPQGDVWGLNGRFSPALPYPIEELQQKFFLSQERLTKPYIRAHFLPELFGGQSEFVKKTFLTTSDNEIFQFLPQFDTQKKIKAWFSTHKDQVDNADKVLEGLYLLHCEVLFLEDLHTPGYFHPRISLHHTHNFADLPAEIQEKLHNLHDDFFFHRHDRFWKESAMKKLPALIASSNMLVCGEDLGMVPACVAEVMDELNILSLEIQRMPKQMELEFGVPANAPYRSVCTTSSHDTNPLRAWWEENPEKTQCYFNDVLHHSGKAPEVCTPEIVREIICRHLDSPAVWVILPLQDWLGIDPAMSCADVHGERINVPDNPENFWCYRMHLNVEDLTAATSFNRKIGEIIRQSGR